MFSVIENGWDNSNVTSEISFEILKTLIKYNPQQENILKMHKLVKGSFEYDEIKRQLPCVKPHGTFYDYCKKENFKKPSGYIFFDIDKGDIESIKQSLLKNHSDKISLLGKSVGGKGIFFYVKIANKEAINARNFLSVQNYLINNIFKEYIIDLNAKGVNRNQVIPFDNNLYSNDVKGLVISKDVIEDNKGAFSYNKDIKERNVNTTPCTFLDIKEVNKHIVWKTVHDIGEAKYVVQDVQTATLFIPRCITDGNKHKSFKAMVNIIMFNNPKIEFTYLVSFINFINSKYTDKPMKIQEMNFVVKSEFNRIKETGVFRYTKTRHVITNSLLDRRTRQLLGARGVGEYKVAKSKNAITTAINILKEAHEKVTQQNVADLLVGRLGLRTIKKYWQQVVPKADNQTEKGIKDSVMNLCSSTEQLIRIKNESERNKQVEIKIDTDISKEASFKKYRIENYTIVYPKTSLEMRLEFEVLWEQQKKAS